MYASRSTSSKEASACHNRPFVESHRFRFITEIHDYPCHANTSRLLDRCALTSRRPAVSRPSPVDAAQSVNTILHVPGHSTMMSKLDAPPRSLIETGPPEARLVPHTNAVKPPVMQLHPFGVSHSASMSHVRRSSRDHGSIVAPPLHRVTDTAAATVMPNAEATNATVSSASAHSFDEADRFRRVLWDRLTLIATNALQSISFVAEAKHFQQQPDLTLPSQSTYAYMHSLEHVREIALDKDEASALTSHCTSNAERVDDHAPQWLRWDAALRRAVPASADHLVDTTGTQSTIIVSKEESSRLPVLRRRTSLLPRSTSTDEAHVPLPENTAAPATEKRLDCPLIPPGRRASRDLIASGLVSSASIAAAVSLENEAARSRLRRGAAGGSEERLAPPPPPHPPHDPSSSDRSTAKPKDDLPPSTKLLNKLLAERGAQRYVDDDAAEERVLDELRQESAIYAAGLEGPAATHRAMAGSKPPPTDMDPAATRQFEKGLLARRLMRNRQQVDYEDRPELDSLQWNRAVQRALAVGTDAGDDEVAASKRMRLQLEESKRSNAAVGIQ